MQIRGSSRTQLAAPYTDHPTLEIYSVTDGQGYLELGGTSSGRWYYIMGRATSSIALYGGSYSLQLKTAGAYFSDNIYFGSNWELYPNSTTSAQIRYSGTWKFAVTQDGDVWAARDLITGGTVGQSANRISKLWASAIDNSGNYYSDTGYVQLASGYFRVGDWTINEEAGTAKLLFSYGGTIRMIIETDGDVWVNDSVDGYQQLTY